MRFSEPHTLYLLLLLPPLGAVAWHFQTVHHDVWDYDVSSQPTLFQIPSVGGGVPAVANGDVSRGGMAVRHSRRREATDGN